MKNLFVAFVMLKNVNVEMLNLFLSGTENTEGYWNLYNGNLEEFLFDFWLFEVESK
jgi:hypothetical protein